MIEPVEKFFRAFGAQQTPYFTVSKNPFAHSPNRLVPAQLERRAVITSAFFGTLPRLWTGCKPSCKSASGTPLTWQPQPDAQHIVLHLPGDARCITLGALWHHLYPCRFRSALCPAGAPLPKAGPPPCLAPCPRRVRQMPAPLITPTGNGWHIGYDILGLAYWMLTRQEEVGRTDLITTRFPAVHSHAYKHSYLSAPSSMSGCTYWGRSSPAPGQALC